MQCSTERNQSFTCVLRQNLPIYTWEKLRRPGYAVESAVHGTSANDTMARIVVGASDGRNVQPVHNERAALVNNLRASNALRKINHQ